MGSRIYWVGPLGGLLALPDVYSPTAAPISRIGGGGASLLGKQWRDTIGHARTWTWKYEALTGRQLALVDALTYGTVPGPLRLVDPWLMNRLPPQLASCGATNRSIDGFAVTAGGLTYRDLRRIAPDPATLTPSPILRGCQEWGRQNGGAGVLYLTGPEADGSWRVPITPDDKVLELSCWVAGAEGLQPELRWTEYDTAGTAFPYYSTADTDTCLLSASTWQRLSVQLDVTARPKNVSLIPRLSLPDASSSGSVFVAAMSVGDPTAEELPPGVNGPCVPRGPDPFGGWRNGGGGPYIVIDPGDRERLTRPFSNAGLVAVETT